MVHTPTLKRVLPTSEGLYPTLKRFLPSLGGSYPTFPDVSDRPLSFLGQRKSLFKLIFYYLGRQAHYMFLKDFLGRRTQYMILDDFHVRRAHTTPATASKNSKQND